MRFVPTGDVLFTTTTASGRKWGARLSTACQTYDMFAEPSSAEGVPTAMKMRSAARTASAVLMVNRKRPVAVCRTISSARPGS